MKKLNRIAALVLALALVFALSACGGNEDKTIDINALAQQLVDAGTFGEPMNPLDSAVALGLYGASEDTKVCAYAGTVATAEEVAVFECADENAANTLKTSLEQRNQNRIAQYASYDAEEVPKLENAVIISGGRYVVIIVAQDASAAEEIAVSALK